MWVPHVFLLKFTHLWIIYAAFGVFGFGCGLTFVTVLRNSWMYFPNNKGFITGIILLGMGGSSLIFTWIADHIINPDYVKIDKATGFFPQEISNRVNNYIFILTILIGVLSVISFLMIFDQFKVVKDGDRENKVRAGNNNVEESNKETLAQTPLSSVQNQIEVEVKSPICQAFRHKQLWQLILMDFCTLCKH